MISLKNVTIIVLMLASSSIRAADIDFTRYLTSFAAGDQPENHTAQFSGVAGAARLMISGVDDTTGITLILNQAVVDLSTSPIGISLQDNNTITIAAATPLTNTVSVRVKQTAEVNLSVESFIHFNTNVSDFTAARAFYGMLGFETISEFPDTNTQAMARAIGIETPTEYDGSQGGEAGGYLLHGELVGPDGFFGGVIDLIEFTIPRNEAPPYDSVNHLGMARGGMQTTDLDADYAYLKDNGVELLSEPVTRSDGTRFVMFKDLDGTFYELIEVEGESEPTTTTHINGMAFVNVNVTDFERSLAWYEMFGYSVIKELPSTDSIEVANAMGLDQPFTIKGAMLEHAKDGSRIELVQWIEPFNAAPPYPIPINNFGIHRMALTSTDIEADVATLVAQGVELISPITPCCSGEDASSSIIAFYDPDGTIVELAEMPYIFKLIGPVIRFFQGIFSD